MFGFCSVGIVWCQPDTSWTCNTTNRQMSKKYIMQDCIKKRGNANFFACSHKKCLISQVPTTTCKMCEILPLEGEGISYGQKHDKLRLKTSTRKYWRVERMWWCYFRAICLYLFCCWSIRTSSWLGRKKRVNFYGFLWLSHDHLNFDFLFPHSSSNSLVFYYTMIVVSHIFVFLPVQKKISSQFVLISLSCYVQTCPIPP